jgi:hypothetical protein
MCHFLNRLKDFLEDPCRYLLLTSLFDFVLMLLKSLDSFGSFSLPS